MKGRRKLRVEERRGDRKNNLLKSFGSYCKRPQKLKLRFDFFIENWVCLPLLQLLANSHKPNIFSGIISWQWWLLGFPDNVRHANQCMIIFSLKKMNQMNKVFVIIINPRLENPNYFMGFLPLLLLIMFDFSLSLFNDCVHSKEENLSAWNRHNDILGSYILKKKNPGSSWKIFSNKKAVQSNNLCFVSF